MQHACYMLRKIDRALLQSMQVKTETSDRLATLFFFRHLGSTASCSDWRNRVKPTLRHHGGMFCYIATNEHSPDLI